MSQGNGFHDLGFARVDIARQHRQGLPEAVYAPGKRTEEIIAICRTLLAHNTGPVLVTRIEPGPAAEVATAIPGAHHDPVARLLSWRPASGRDFRVAVVTAGTADGPVAAEAAAVARAIGLTVTEVNDVGVAGLHRLLAAADDLAACDAVIVVAGMEGALASAVGGLEVGS